MVSALFFEMRVVLNLKIVKEVNFCQLGTLPNRFYCLFKCKTNQSSGKTRSYI